MTGELTIRIAAPSDAQVVHELLFEFNGEALSPHLLAAHLAEGTVVQETAFLAESDGVAAGLLVLRIVPTLSDPQDWAEITEMYVRPAFRRRGIGTALVETALEHSRRRGCAEIHLLVNPDNRAAQRFYRAQGFGRDSWEMRRRT